MVVIEDLTNQQNKQHAQDAEKAQGAANDASARARNEKLEKNQNVDEYHGVNKTAAGAKKKRDKDKVEVTADDADKVKDKPKQVEFPEQRCLRYVETMLLIGWVAASLCLGVYFYAKWNGWQKKDRTVKWDELDHSHEFEL